MSLQTVDVVHELEEALGVVESEISALLTDVRMSLPLAQYPAAHQELQRRLEAIRAGAAAAGGAGSCLAEWRGEG